MIHESGIIYWWIHRGWVGVADPPPPYLNFKIKKKNVTKQSIKTEESKRKRQKE